MIIPVSKVRIETKITDHDVGLRKWRRVIDIDWSSIMLTEQMMSERFSGKWNSRGRYFSFHVANQWKWGRKDFYYDGPHKVFCVGPATFASGW